MIVTAFALGIALGFIFFEITGLTAGGIIVPGYIALFIDKPIAILITIIAALFTYSIVIILSKRMIIFGRRRFLLMVLTGFMLRIIFDYFFMLYMHHDFELQIIGYVIPGLIANEFARQGIIKTILAMSIVSGMVYLLLRIIQYFQI